MYPVGGGETGNLINFGCSNTLPETNRTLPRPSQKERIVFQPSIFRGELLVPGRVFIFFRGHSFFRCELLNFRGCTLFQCFFLDAEVPCSCEGDFWRNEDYKVNRMWLMIIGFYLTKNRRRKENPGNWAVQMVGVLGNGTTPPKGELPKIVW